MAQIDQFIEAIRKYEANGLVMEAGKRVTLLVNGQSRPITKQELSAEQIRMLITEIAPSAIRDGMRTPGTHTFRHEVAGVSVEIEVASSESGVSDLRITPTSGSSQGSSQGSGSASGQSSGQGSGSASSQGSSQGSSSGAGNAADSTITPESAPGHGGSTGSTNGDTLSNGDSTAVRRPEIPRHAVVTPVRAGATAGSLEGSPPIEVLLRKLVAELCSDLHLTSGNPPLYRKDGDITTLGDDGEKTAEEVQSLLHGIMSEKHRAEFEETHDVDFAYEIPGLARYRCNVFMDRLGMGGVFRVVPSRIPTAEDLGISPAILELCTLHKGLIVVTGPTGSGKSTTLAAMIDSINRSQPRHIITIEDPIEFVHPKQQCLINQREVGIHTKGFKNALRAALREDPDIVLVGEMRDLETVAIALETAETGHLVFGTLHTNTAPATVDRIIDQFPPDQQAQIRVLLSDTLKGVIAQTLCKKKMGGRVAAQEVLIVNAAISNLIREGKTYQIPSLMQTGKAAGMRTLDSSLLELVQKGIVDPEEALNKSVTKNEFRGLLERNNVVLKKAA